MKLQFINSDQFCCSVFNPHKHISLVGWSLNKQQEHPLSLYSHDHLRWWVGCGTQYYRLELCLLQHGLLQEPYTLHHRDRYRRCLHRRRHLGEIQG